MSQNGKGSRQRPQSKEERQRFEDNWSAIFGKKEQSAESAAKQAQVVKMTRKEFDALGEYSLTLPTSPSPGRRWKCARPAFNPKNWYLGEAYELPKDDPDHGKQVGIRWSLIEIA